MTINERIKQRRLELGLSVDDILKSLNISRATYYRYESAEVEKMPIDILPPLSEVLKTTPEYLMCLTDNPYPYRRESMRKLREDELYLNDVYNSLNDEGKKEARKYLENLAYIPKYKAVFVRESELLAAHADDPNADLSEDIETFKREIEKRKQKR